MAVDSASVELRPVPDPGSDAFVRQRTIRAASASIALVGLGVAALVVSGAGLAFSPGLLFATLLVLAFVSYFSTMVIKDSLVFDASLVAVMLALVFIGPVAAVVIMLATELVAWMFERYRLVAVAANVASYIWGILAAWALLSAFAEIPMTAQSAALGSIALAGISYWAVNVLTMRSLLGGLADGRSARAVIKESWDLTPVALLMVALGVATAFLYTQIGILALGIFAAITLIPQLILPVLLRPRPVEELSHAEAVALYSQAIASVLKLDSTMKEILSDAAQHIEGPDAQANGSKIKAGYSGEHFHDVVEAVLYYREHWDSPDGFPGGVGGEMIPLSSRILAVADNWAQLTASGVWTVTHAQAMNKLGEHSGVEYDPHVVSAAVKVVEEERMGLTDNQPQLHEVPLPQLVRKVPRLSGVISGLAGNRA